MTGEPSLFERLKPLADQLRGRMAANQPMSKLTWFQAGGPAQVLFQPADEDDLAAFLEGLPQDVPVTVVGVGSNLLVRDGGLDGVVIRLSAKGFGGIENIGANRLKAGAAVLDKTLAAAALEHGIGGFEFYHGIPGGIGGALYMNAGANGTETTNRVVEVHGVTRDGKKLTLSHADMGYTYRHSNAPQGMIFTSAVFEGEAKPRDEIRKRNGRCPASPRIGAAGQGKDRRFDLQEPARPFGLEADRRGRHARGANRRRADEPDALQFHDQYWRRKRARP